MKWIIFFFAVPKLLNRYAKNYKPRVLAILIIGVVLFWRIGSFNREMNQACFRLRTDTFDNYYDGITPVPKKFMPKYLPKSYNRGEEFIDLEQVKCKLRSSSFSMCWDYYFSENVHKEIWETQTTCKARHNADLASVFKDRIPDPKTQVLGWRKPDNSPKNFPTLNVVRKVVPYFAKELAEPTDPIEIKDSPKEFFIDFRGKNAKKGKPIVQAKDFRKFDPEIKKRMEGKDESYDHPSVLRIFYDTTSRFRFYRKFPKTIKFLTNLKNNPDSTHEVVESLKFHNHAGFTNPNQIAYNYGISSE
jgi:hypothetical protein